MKKSFPKPGPSSAIVRLLASRVVVCRQVLKKILQRFAQTAQIDVQCKSSPASAADGISEKISEMHD
ncbi:hypothetical protein, partial [Comamonas aquatica]|uniref:hypothetical protein n=1 Tax=Comamonas aquatica TaxID=225991 RepID=UPI001C3F2A2D